MLAPNFTNGGEMMKTAVQCCIDVSIGRRVQLNTKDVKSSGKQVNTLPSEAMMC